LTFEIFSFLSEDDDEHENGEGKVKKDDRSNIKLNRDYLDASGLKWLKCGVLQPPEGRQVCVRVCAYLIHVKIL